MKSSVILILKTCALCLAAMTLAFLTSACSPLSKGGGMEAAGTNPTSSTDPSKRNNDNGSEPTDQNGNTLSFCSNGDKGNDNSDEMDVVEDMNILAAAADDAESGCEKGKGGCVSVCVDGENLFIKKQAACGLAESGSEVVEGGCL